MDSTASVSDVDMQNIKIGFEDNVEYREVNICTTDDADDETDEEFFLRLTPDDDDDAVHIGSVNIATVVIVDDGDTRK